MLLSSFYECSSDSLAMLVEPYAIIRCKRLDWFNPDNGYVCCAHFDEDDFEVDMLAKIMGFPGKRTLKVTAVPHKNLPASASTPCSSSAPYQYESTSAASYSSRMLRRPENQVPTYSIMVINIIISNI